MGIPCHSGGKMENQSLIDSDAVKRIYRFDSMKNQCVPFGYFGCGGNWNHFNTEHLCTLRCSKHHLLSLSHSFLFHFDRSLSNHLPSLYRCYLYRQIRFRLHHRISRTTSWCIDLHHVSTIRSQKWTFPGENSRARHG